MREQEAWAVRVAAAAAAVSEGRCDLAVLVGVEPPHELVELRGVGPAEGGGAGEVSCGELCRCARVERCHVRDASRCRFSKLIDSIADMSSSRETTPSSSKSSVLNAWPIDPREA